MVDDWFDAKTSAEVAAAEPTLITNFNRDHAGTVVHRMTRFLAYAEVPYDVTLYLDDDMYVCPGEPLGPLLRDVARRGGPVQLAERWLAQGSANKNEDARRITRASGQKATNSTTRRRRGTG